MRLFVTANPERPNIAKPFADAVLSLVGLGAQVLLDEGEAEALGFNDNDCEYVKSRSDGIRKCDYVVAVGGDGTIFHAAAEAMLYDRAVLGINAGRLGFLAQAEAGDREKLKELVSGSFSLEERLVLSAEITRDDGTVKKAFAVNDIVIARPDFGRVCDIEVRCDGHFVGSYRADGLIFATPTGSTAYSLSAGGPIVDSTVSCILMTPLASHSLVSRSIVFDGGKTLRVQSPECAENAFFLLADGKAIDAVGENDAVTIKKAEYKTRFICLNGHNFYQVLTDKMKNRG